MSVQNSNLISLPLELRLIIYTYHFRAMEIEVKDFVKDMHSSSIKVPWAMALLQTCRQIKHEAFPVFYSQPLFKISIPYGRFHIYGARHGIDYPLEPVVFRGLRHIALPVEALRQIGYDFCFPGSWNINKPFDATQHLTVELREPFTANQCCPKHNALSAWYQEMMPGKYAGALKLMCESPGYPFRLSLHLNCVWSAETRTELVMVDVAQISTWQCKGHPLGIHFRFLHRFLHGWGLSGGQIKDVLLRGDTPWHSYRRQQGQDAGDEIGLLGFEVERTCREIEELATEGAVAQGV